MSKIMTAEDWVKSTDWKDVPNDENWNWVKLLMEHRDKYVRDTTLEVAAEKAEYDISGNHEISVDKSSILDLKNSDDLKI